MTFRSLTHVITLVGLAFALVFAGLVTAVPQADAAALLKQRAHGQLHSPIKPGKFRVSQHFHGGHGGIDLAAPTRTPVGATAAGRVVKVRKWRNSYGKHVVIKHAGGQTLSAHLSSVRVRQGQKVHRGQKIGAVGSTGNSTGPHLHFELKKGGRAVNPAPWLWR